MNIFIGNIPGKKYEHEINNLLTTFDKNVQGQIKQRIQKNDDRGYFCIASINNEKKARRFIQKLNQKSPYGELLQIREFIHRAYGNDQRDIWHGKKWKGIEKRENDRRMPALPLD